jgi:hypothetical protein
MNAIQLWWFMNRRTREAARHSKDPASITSLLTVVAFASVTALLLIVLGGIAAFEFRAHQPGATSNSQSYVAFAYIAGALLLVPLLTMGGAAARLVVARRDERLARLRLVGATTAQITVLSALDAATSAFIGMLCGIGGYFALIPAIGLIPFEGRGFTFSELWVGPALLAAVGLGVIVLGTVSALVGLQRVVVSPLGVAQRQSTPALKAIRILAVVLAFIGMILATKTSLASFLFIGIMFAVGLGTLNLVGPFVMGIVGQFAASRAKTLDVLLASRRIIDDPKTAWRSVGGVALATFIAGLASVMALLSGYEGRTPEDVMFATDISTGGYLTLAIAGVLAAISTGVTQAGRVISQREQYRFLHLAGTGVPTLERARIKETTIPMIAAVGTALALSALFLVPMFGAGLFQNPLVLVRFAVSVAFAVGLVLVGTLASRRLVTAVARLD